jgi:hypothetical protein
MARRLINLKTIPLILVVSLMALFRVVHADGVQPNNMDKIMQLIKSDVTQRKAVELFKQDSQFRKISDPYKNCMIDIVSGDDHDRLVECRRWFQLEITTHDFRLEWYSPMTGVIPVATNQRS